VIATVGVNATVRWRFSALDNSHGATAARRARCPRAADAFVEVVSTMRAMATPRPKCADERRESECQEDGISPPFSKTKGSSDFSLRRSRIQEVL
jgi:hypothetical protein